MTVLLHRGPLPVVGSAELERTVAQPVSARTSVRSPRNDMPRRAIRSLSDRCTQSNGCALRRCSMALRAKTPADVWTGSTAGNPVPIGWAPDRKGGRDGRTTAPEGRPRQDQEDLDAPRVDDRPWREDARGVLHQGPRRAAGPRGDRGGDPLPRTQGASQGQGLGPGGL